MTRSYVGDDSRWPPGWPVPEPAPRPGPPGAPATRVALAFDRALRAARREDVVARAVAELRQDGAGRDEPLVTVRAFDDGCLVVAVAGWFGWQMVERLGGLVRDLSPLADQELVLELSGLTGHHWTLAPLLGRTWTRFTVEGVRVELRDPPHDLAAELGRPGWGTIVDDISDARRDATVRPGPRHRREEVGRER